MADGVSRFEAGHEFIDPDTGQGYRLTSPLTAGAIFKSAQFEPINGAPKPEVGATLPFWLCERLGSVR